MFDSIRKHQRLLQFVLLLLIFPAFAFFGVSGYQKFWSGADHVATVAGEPISRQEFDQAQRRQLENLKQMLGGQFDPRIVDNDSARAEVLEGLIAQRALLAEANKKHIQVPDEKLRQAILSIPGVKKADGSFDRDQYKALLSAQATSEAVFESQMRRDLALQAIPESIAQTGVIPNSVIDRMQALQEETREVREWTFKADDFAAQVQPSDEQLKKYYEDNARLFETSESAKVEYAVLNADTLAVQVVIDPTKIKEYFEQNKSKYVIAEQRKASHVLLKVPKDADDASKKAIRAKADALLAQAKTGGDFAALAKANSQDEGSASEGGDLGFFGPDMMVKPFSEAAFALKDGQISEVVETEFGYHFIKLTGIKAKLERGFEQVKDEIEAEFRRQEALKEFAKAAETFNNTVYEQSDSFKPVADKLKVKVQTVESLNRTGGTGAEPIPVLNNPKLLGALFGADSIKNKRNIESVEVAPNTLVSARIVEHRAAQRKPYETVQADVRAGFVKQEAKKLAILAGEAKLKELKGGELKDAQLKDAQLKDAQLKEAEADTKLSSGFGEIKKITRQGAPGIAPNATEPLFRLASAKLPAYVGVDLATTGYGLYELVRVVAADSKVLAEKRSQFAQQLTQTQSQQDLNDYLDTVKKRSDVVRSLSKLRSATAQDQ